MKPNPYTSLGSFGISLILNAAWVRTTCGISDILNLSWVRGKLIQPIEEIPSAIWNIKEKHAFVNLVRPNKMLAYHRK